MSVNVNVNVETLHGVERDRPEAAQGGWRSFFRRECPVTAVAREHTQQPQQAPTSEHKPGKYLSDWWLEM